MKITTVLLDLDDVLVDFTSAACRVHGICPDELAEKRTPGNWSWTTGPWLQMSATEFWKPINAAGKRFWEELRPTPWFQELLYLADTLVDDVNTWHTVTSPSRCETSYAGKVAWLKTQFGESFNRFLITPHKELLARPGTLLIDDRERNVERFVEAGGKAVVFPTLGNRFYAHRHNPVEYLESILLGETQCT